MGDHQTPKIFRSKNLFTKNLFSMPNPTQKNSLICYFNGTIILEIQQKMADMS